MIKNETISRLFMARLDSAEDPTKELESSTDQIKKDIQDLEEDMLKLCEEGKREIFKAKLDEFKMLRDMLADKESEKWFERGVQDGLNLIK